MVSCSLQLSMVLVLLLQLLLKSTSPKAAAHPSRAGLARVGVMGKVRGGVTGGSGVPGMMRLPAGKLGKLLQLLPQLWCHLWAIDWQLPPLRLQLQQVSHNIIAPCHPSPPPVVPIPSLPIPAYLAPPTHPAHPLPFSPPIPFWTPTPSPFHPFLSILISSAPIRINRIRFRHACRCIVSNCLPQQNAHTYKTLARPSNTCTACT